MIKYLKLAPNAALAGFAGVLLMALATAGPLRAAAVNVGVAHNFTAPVKEIADRFAAETGHQAILSFGTTGQLYTQITQGAPFGVFLAADRDRPALAVEAGTALADSRFTYAVGRLVLFSRDAGRVSGEDVLRKGDFTRLAIANPAAAPYGAAAIDVLTTLDLRETLAPKIVQGNNVTQAYQFVATGNAELGFVALSQIVNVDGGSRWIVPEHLHRPIAQDAVLLKTGADNPAARAFVEFLKGEQARAIMERFGYAPGG